MNFYYILLLFYIYIFFIIIFFYLTRCGYSPVAAGGPCPSGPFHLPPRHKPLSCGGHARGRCQQVPPPFRDQGQVDTAGNNALCAVSLVTLILCYAN